MAVGEENWWDKDYKASADLIIDGQRFIQQEVQGDKRIGDRRDVFPSNDVREKYSDDLPDQAMVEWYGTMYPARLSFRYRDGGGAIPVYEFFVDVKTRKQLSMKD